MNRRSWISVILITLILLVSITGCTKQATQPSKPSIEQISIAGAGTAGTFYIMAAGIADLINRKLDIKSVPEVTAGSVENAKLLDTKRVEMAVMQMDVALNALAGIGAFSKAIDIMAATPMYPNAVQIITLKGSPIQSFSDLKDKKVSVGSPGSGILATNEAILQALGLSMQDIKPQYLSFAETTDAFRNGSIDAAIVNTAAPAPWVVDLETSHPVKLIALSSQEIKELSTKLPHFVDATIPKEAYKSLDVDVPTIAVWIFLATRSDIPEQAVYDVVRTIMENQNALKEVHVMAQFITGANVPSIKGVPYHPGAVKYFKEKGVPLP